MGKLILGESMIYGATQKYSTAYTCNASTLNAESVTKVMQEAVFKLNYDVPEERFVTYEASDLEWLLYCGIARKKPRFDTCIVNPKTYKRITDMIDAQALGVKVIQSDYIPEDEAFLGEGQYAGF